MKKIRICSVDEDGRYGGPQSRVLEIEKNIDKKKFSIEYIIPKKQEIFENKLKKYNSLIIKVNLSRLSKNLSEFFNYSFNFIPELLALIKIFKKKKFDIVQANGVTHFKSVLAAKLAKKKIIWIIEDSYAPKVIVQMFKLLARITNCKIVYISKKVFSFYIKNSNIKRENLYEIMSPTDTKFFQKKRKKKKNNELVVTTISNITEVKGVDIFLETAQKVLTKNLKAKFYFVGGKVKNQYKYAKKIELNHMKIQKKIRKKIIFKGMDLKIKKILQNTDIFVCTSNSEGGPIALWEAMSMSIPVVSTKVGGAPQYIKNGFNGYLCNISDSKNISKKIYRLMLSSKLRNKIGINARKTIQKYIDSSKITRKYEKLYVAASN